jgi:hypothetical protein
MSNNVMTRADLIRLSGERRRRLETLYALSDGTDPHMADTPSRRILAEWIADIFTQMAFPGPVHIRAIHYRLISLETPEIMPDGQAYENTTDCFGTLCYAVRDARYLGLIKAEAIIDRKNPPARIYYHPVVDLDATASIYEGEIKKTEYGANYKPPELDFPVTLFGKPVRGQPAMIEIWVEKSGINDIVDPIGREFGVNVQTFTGEASSTACTNLIERAIEAGRPVRILHIVDQDPAGDDMPVSAAVKIGFWIKKHAPDLDIRLYHICLTADQVEEFNLPRTPIKSGEKRKDDFANRFGSGGGTELDALETLYPGALRDIILEQINRFRDEDLESDLAAAIDEFEGLQSDADEEIETEFAESIAGWRNSRDAIATTFEERVARAREKRDRIVSLAYARFSRVLDAAEDEIMAMEEDLVADGEDLLRRMASHLEEIAPDPDDHDWPEARDIDEDDDALFDSKRDYVDQVDIFREHAGITEDVRFAADIMETKTCKRCNKPFETGVSKKCFCSKNCRTMFNRKASKERKGRAMSAPVAKPVTLA